MSDWIPPGYIDVTALVREHGIDKVRSDLFSGRRQAFKWDGTAGNLIEIEPRFWCSDEAERWLAARMVSSSAASTGISPSAVS